MLNDLTPVWTRSSCARCVRSLGGAQDGPEKETELQRFPVRLLRRGGRGQAPAARLSTGWRGASVPERSGRWRPWPIQSSAPVASARRAIQELAGWTSSPGASTVVWMRFGRGGKERLGVGDLAQGAATREASWAKFIKAQDLFDELSAPVWPTPLDQAPCSAPLAHRRFADR